MTLDDKRKAIEALLCASGNNDQISLYEAMAAVGCSPSVMLGVSDDSYRIDPVSKKMRVDQRYGRSAYRLIESSPTLRREWFGAA